MLCAHAHTHRLPLLAFPVGAASVLSCRVSRACLRCVGYARAALCGPLVASRPPGDLKNTTNPHQITLGPPPVSFGLRGAGFQSRFKKERAEVDRPIASIQFEWSMSGCTSATSPGSPLTCRDDVVHKK